ncbi:heavy-metal-associated domain-containing protein [Corynebacterium sp. A21]|uniref:heavy-metal-associated domain-containing protein n=1 Tax=Corynebacterium sp. A21 TaxID=3457318 RepID=UPI003FD05F49
MSTLEYTVTGMTCGHCEASVQEEVSEIPGVTTAKANKDTKLLTVTTEGELDDAAVIAAVKEAGYEAVRK